MENLVALFACAVSHATANKVSKMKVYQKQNVHMILKLLMRLTTKMIKIHATWSYSALKLAIFGGVSQCISAQKL